MLRSGPYGYHLAALFCVTVWGATFVSTKVLIAHGLAPAEIFLLRFAMAYLGLLPFPPGSRRAGSSAAGRGRGGAGGLGTLGACGEGGEARGLFSPPLI